MPRTCRSSSFETADSEYLSANHFWRAQGTLATWITAFCGLRSALHAEMAKLCGCEMRQRYTQGHQEFTIVEVLARAMLVSETRFTCSEVQLVLGPKLTHRLLLACHSKPGAAVQDLQSCHMLLGSRRRCYHASGFGSALAACAITSLASPPWMKLVGPGLLPTLTRIALCLLCFHGNGAHLRTLERLAHS